MLYLSGLLSLKQIYIKQEEDAWYLHLATDPQNPSTNTARTYVDIHYRNILSIKH